MRIGLRLRLLFFVLLPTAVLLAVMGVSGFWYARDKLHSQWRESVILMLQQAGHRVDMRLAEPKQLIKLYLESVALPDSDYFRQWLLGRLQAMDGVAYARLESLDGTVDEQEPKTQPGMGRPGMGRGMMLRVSPPKYIEGLNEQVVLLDSTVNDLAGRPVARLAVAVTYDYLIQNLKTYGTWHSKTAILVDQDGRVLTGTEFGGWPSAEGGEALKKATLEALKEKPYGTVLGPGSPAGLMSGFYKLEEAPWSLVMFASSREVMADLFDLQYYYATVVVVFALLILLLVLVVTGPTITAVKSVSLAARHLAAGRFDPPLPVRSQDEVGELTQSFNAMMDQLKDRLRIKKSIDLAMEVQQTLLPQNPPVIKGLDLAGRSMYCDETGGDYFDYVPRSLDHRKSLIVFVGDVSDHGLPSALLMTTARAFLRQRASLAGGPGEILTDVNHLLALDTVQSGLFMTLFCAEIDVLEKNITWAVAGHDPALVYSVAGDRFGELAGRGLALGLVEDYVYEDFKDELRAGHILVIGTDGIWESKNAEGENFGKGRLREAVAAHRNEGSADILKGIVDAVEAFRGAIPLADDLTLVVIKTPN